MVKNIIKSMMNSSLNRIEPDVQIKINICDEGDPLWDSSLTWNTDKPTVTSCFIDVAMTWPPLLFLWLCAPYAFHVYYYSTNPLVSKWSRFYFFKFLTIGFLMLISLANAIYFTVLHNKNDSLIVSYHISTATVLAGWFSVVTNILMFLFLFMQRRHGFTNNGFVWFYLLWTILFGSIIVAKTADSRSRSVIVLTSIEYALEIILFVFCSFCDSPPNHQEFLLNNLPSESNTTKFVSNDKPITEKSSYENQIENIKPVQKMLCPKEMASIPSKLTFWWFNSLSYKGFKRPLTTNDLWNTKAFNWTKNMFKVFNQYWKHPKFETISGTSLQDQLNDNKKVLIINEKSKNGQKKPFVNLWMMLIKMFWLYFLIPSIARLLTDLLQLANPMVLKAMIAFVKDVEAPLWKGIVFSLVFILTNVFQSLTGAYQTHRMSVLSMRIRSVLISAIYRKSLVMAGSEKRNFTTGEIINLMAVDSQRFVDLLPFISFIFTSPFQIIIGLVLLWKELGPSVLGGMVLMILFIPLNSFIANQVKKIQRTQMFLKDKRLKAINEMLNGIKVLKLYAWEKAFVKNVVEFRSEELKNLRRAGFVSTVFVCLGSCSPFLVSCLTFAIYTFTSETGLTAEKAFVSISLFNLLRLPLMMIPNLLSALILTMVSIKRINRYLNCDETEDYVQRKVDKDDAIKVSDASFSWIQEKKEKSVFSNCILSKLNLTIPKGKLVAVVGPVGSGKSSLLYSLLGETQIQSGSVNISGDLKIAYVAQQAWIQNLTVRDNILFGREYIQKKYDQVIHACALKSDLKMLGGGDQTEIGEKGINLSGGQKQRVSIARACYSGADLFLFDDPLSAVDSHVGKHIFENVLSSDKGILRDQTRVLVTNALYVLPFVDQVIVLKNGTVDVVGPYQQLLNENETFRELINTYNQSNQDQENMEESEVLITKEEEVIVEPEQMEQIISLPRSISVSSYHSRTMRQFSRQQSSIKHKQSDQANKDQDKAKLVEAEAVETGQITLSVYKKFVSAISPIWFGMIMINYVGSAASNAGSNLWLSHWTEMAEKGDSHSNKYLLIYFIIGVMQIVFVCVGWSSIVLGMLNASRTLHQRLLTSIMHAPMHFFDTTPLGRIINRFSKDIDILDVSMNFLIRVLLNNTLQLVATIVIVSMQTPIFLAFVLPFMILYYFIQRYYIATSRQLKRLEAVTRSPIFTHFSETINGTSTIKAYKATQRFIDESDIRVDNNQKCFYPNQVAYVWLQVRLEFMANLLIFFASFIATMTKGDLSGSQIGLSLSYAFNVTLNLNWCVRMFGDLENNIVSVERISEYTDVSPEAAWELETDEKLSKDWPDKGIIEFQEYATRYRPGLDLVLKGIDVMIKEGEKIGIVGRTGAGKSSLTLALFRIIEASNGSILIDNVKISSLGLYRLRSRITIIPQDPVLFFGTIRFNLDPFNNFNDGQLWNSLEQAHLKSYVSSLELGLEHVVTEGGENLSVGQRQLICLARALLRRTKVLVLDEATAAVDLETDSLIQNTISREFSSCTVLTIAHRLNTILDSDRVMVLDAGRIAEFESPRSLLSKPSSIFYSLAKDAGIVN